jgi:hypothetical protein
MRLFAVGASYRAIAAAPGFDHDLGGIIGLPTDGAEHHYRRRSATHPGDCDDRQHIVAVVAGSAGVVSAGASAECNGQLKF